MARKRLLLALAVFKHDSGLILAHDLRNCKYRIDSNIDTTLQSKNIHPMDLDKGYLSVGRSKTEAGKGRTIPLNSALHQALADYAEWYKERFGGVRPDSYIFPFGGPRPNDPARPVSMEISPGAYAKVQGFDRERSLLTVERPAAEKLTSDPSGLQGVTVYRESERGFSEGDRVQFTAPTKC